MEAFQCAYCVNYIICIYYSKFTLCYVSGYRYIARVTASRMLHYSGTPSLHFCKETGWIERTSIKQKSGILPFTAMPRRQGTFAHVPHWLCTRPMLHRE